MHTVANTGPESTTHRLVGWGSFLNLQDQIRARLFGHLVVLATPVVKEYHSDLFHDAQWLRDNVVGETEFHFVVRDSGTGVGPTARFQKDSPGAVMYRLSLTCDRRYTSGHPDHDPSGEWSLTITRM